MDLIPVVISRMSRALRLSRKVIIDKPTWLMSNSI